MAEYNQKNILAFMSDLRADREELVISRQFYDRLFTLLDGDYKDGEIFIRAVLEMVKVQDDYWRARDAERIIELSPPVDGYE